MDALDHADGPRSQGGHAASRPALMIPPCMTAMKLDRSSSRVMSPSTSPSTTSRSASLPVSSVPSSCSRPISSAPILVAPRMVSSGEKPTFFTKKLSSLAYPPCGLHAMPKSPPPVATRPPPLRTLRALSEPASRIALCPSTSSCAQPNSPTQQQYSYNTESVPRACPVPGASPNTHRP